MKVETEKKIYQVNLSEQRIGDLRMRGVAQFTSHISKSQVKRYNILKYIMYKDINCYNVNVYIGEIRLVIFSFCSLFVVIL